MDPKRTAWEHVLEEPVVNHPGEYPMKAELDARFDGTFAQLITWMEQTFRNPGDLRLRVIVGGNVLRPEEPEPVRQVRTVEGAKLVKLLATRNIPAMKRGDVEDVIAKVWKMSTGGDKVAAIRSLREAARIGLADAKVFVEGFSTVALAPTPTDEDIPF
jgi:hypothetical protein